MEKAIIELLAGLSSDMPVDGSLKLSPSLDIKGDLATYIDTLMHRVGSKINQSPSDVFEAVLAKGISQWLNDLPPVDKKTIGYQPVQEQERGNRSRIPQRRQQDGNMRGNEHDYDPVAVKAQQAAYDQLNEQFGYTPMTAHAVPASGSAKGDSRSKNSGGKGGSRKKYSRHTRKPQGGRSSGRSGGSRRRSSGGGRGQ